MLAIETVSLTRKFGDLVAVDRVNLKVEEGELFGLLGPNGAGKTTTLRMLCCLLTPTDGTAQVGGYDVQKDAAEIRKIIGVCPQETTMYERLTGRENVELIGKMHKLPKTELKKRTNALLEKMELLDRANEQVKNYSGGMKRRLDIIMALVHNPQILFLDEPTLGLDPAARRVVWDFIGELKKKKKTIILTTHYMDEADVLCDRVAVIDYGKIIAEDTPGQLKEKIGAGDVIEIDFTGDFASAIKSLEKFKFVRKVSKIQGHLVIVAEAGITRLGEITNTIHGCGGSVGKIAVRQNTLEDVFIHLTGRRLGE